MANKNKATHSGTCQACGRGQKLPNGVLAIHGYTTRWGFFSGICPGSGHKPFELSTDYIEFCIHSSAKEAAKLRGEAEALLAEDPTGQTEFWFSEYVAATYALPSHYRWVRATATFDEHSISRVTTVPDHNGNSKTVFATRTDVRGRTIEDVVLAQNIKRADAFEAVARKHDEYIVWQQERVANWTLGTLTPVVAPVGPLLHAPKVGKNADHYTACGRRRVSIRGRITAHVASEGVTCHKCLSEGGAR